MKSTLNQPLMGLSWNFVLCCTCSEGQTDSETDNATDTRLGSDG